MQSVDANYPLYGDLELQPAISLDDATALTNETWGIAIDPVLADQLDMSVGDRVDIGAMRMEVRALIETQPDRRLNADWRGPPLLIGTDALAATELVRQGSRVEYEYRVKTDRDPDAWLSSICLKSVCWPAWLDSPELSSVSASPSWAPLLRKPRLR